jgi:hypothetical protein
VHACPARATSITNGISAIPRAMWAATFTDMQRRVDLRLQAEGNQFQHLLQPNYIYQDIYSPNFVFVSKLLRGL